MLTKPGIADTLIISRLKDEYNLHASTLTFLPLGADAGTAVYRVVADDGTACFLKLRKGFDEISVTVPLFLRSQGIQEIIAPFETRSGHGWADMGGYKMILYPFIEGKNGFEMELSDSHKRAFGEALKAIHSVQLPPELRKQIPQETFSKKYRERVKEFQRLVEKSTFSDWNAARLADFIKSKRNEIDHLIQRTEELAMEVQTRSLELVLCHTDIHGANILIADDNPSGNSARGGLLREASPLYAAGDGGLGNSGGDTNYQFYIVDWDAPLLAPRERDLMFIGGGIDDIWKSKRDESVFHEGYGKTDIDPAMMAYYRHERVIEDLAAYGEQLLMTDEGGADREEAYRRFTGNFEPGQTIEIADKTDKLLKIY